MVAGSAHALTPVDGVPVVVRAARVLRATGLVDRIVVLAEPALHAALELACAAEPVSVRAGGLHALLDVGAHTAQRASDTIGDAVSTAGVREIVLLHDARRPMAPGALVAAVVAAVRHGHEMAVPVLPLTDTVKRVDGSGVLTATPDRSALRVLQTPIALRADLLPAEIGADPLDVVRRHTAAGGTVHTVAGHPSAFALHSPWDLELAELVAQGTIAL
ncbi:2-C-methyl-D-erythritol 4-phosphate cytidylyltransferase [Pseudonocardia sp. MH-G8]|uniref:2-C-methyl-D-erythritol 4-phosphate cytidylyltransferase n=1 Tax=Pseudonocardia sp. MH-G8 TaxID=1854588 RepID=UPI0026ABDDF5